jgi:hypothetical protein
MTEQNPIAPPPELRSKWFNETPRADIYDYIIEMAAQYGADAELDACCEWLMYESDRKGLRAARRPKPPSLKQQSIALIDLIQGNEKSWQLEDLDVIRQALEKLPDE